MPILVLLGGFLGAGKTTLILTAARLLGIRGLKTAAILNDQGSELVDTQYVKASGVDADQVSGGCFCCRFSDLIDAAERLAAHSPAVIFAEAVGSCTDISATTLQPLKLHYRHEFRLAPYTVLVDPERAREFSEAQRARLRATSQQGDSLDLPGARLTPRPFWAGSSDEQASDLSFLFHKQLQEADLVCMTKVDLHPDYPTLPGISARYISPLTGEGVDAWLDEVLGMHQPVGGKILEIDYGRYARAEAALAWLNCSVTVTLTSALAPSSIVGPLLENLDNILTANKISIAHLKLIDECSTGYVKASLVRNGEEPFVQGILDASPASTHEVLLNLRALSEPDPLQHLVEEQLSKLPGNITISAMQCFSPAAPKPAYRLTSVVG